MILFLFLTVICVWLYIKYYTKDGVPPAVENDFKILIPVIVVAGVIGICGGSVKWANSTANFFAFLFMGFILPTFGIIEGIRIRNVKIAGLYSAAVALTMSVVSSFFYFEGLGSVLGSVIFGFLFGGISAKVAKKKLG